MKEQKKALTIIGAAIVILILLEVIFVDHHGKFWWHDLLAFDVLYGFFGGIMLIVFSKTLGKVFIQRKEDFYGGGEDDE